MGGDALRLMSRARAARREWLQQIHFMNNANESKLLQNSCASFFLVQVL